MALINHRGLPDLVAESARAEPHERVNERTIAVLREVGIDVADLKPQRLIPGLLERADRVIRLDWPLPSDLASIAAPKLETWPMPDTLGKPVETVREVRDLVGARVERLVGELTER